MLIGDRIDQVDGVSTYDMKVAEVAQMIRGELDTEVTLSLFRPETERSWDETLVRSKIEIAAVKDARIVGRAIGYMRISDFQEHTVEQVDEALRDLEKDGMKALILDLRNNDGGLLPKAVELAERFLPKDSLVVSVKSNVPEQKREHRTTGEYYFGDLPMVVLINQLSASAAEIFSAAMKDHERATIVGQKSYGKASVQSVIPLDDVSAMKLTTARYISPGGHMIDGIGLEPNIAVKNRSPGKRNRDQQIRKAVELLKRYY